MTKKTRADSFFGLHFDFHAHEDTVIGSVIQPEVIAKMLDEVKPDYVQIDTKGHPGYSSYPTKAGTPAPDMRGDIARMWRELTEERGIALYAHHSGIYDLKVLADHPDWAAVDAEGKPSDKFLSMFSPFADEVLIPQLKELALNYGMDGAWVDGECWATMPDYSDRARAAWAKISDNPPPKPGEEGFDRYLTFMRNAFEAYVTHYIEELKKVAPDFQITSNWMYSAYIPQLPKAPIDFISGDYSPNNSVNSAREHGRFIACQNMPWDLMAWGHNATYGWKTDNRSTKEPLQHCQEAAYVMSLGGGFQFYNIQYGGGGTVQNWAIPIWKKAGEFVREREPFCKGTKLIPQVGIVMSTDAHNAEISGIFQQNSPSMISAKGLIGAVQDAGYSSEILLTHNVLEKDLSDYGALILGRARFVEPEVKAALLDYVKKGGSLLFASAESAKLFADELGWKLGDTDTRMLHLGHGGVYAPLLTQTAAFEETAGEVCGEFYNDNFEHDGPYPAAVCVSLEEGKAEALGFDLGSAYPNNRTSCLRSFVRSQLKRLFPRPLASAAGSDYAELTVTGRDNKVFVHVLNYGGPHAEPGVRSYNELPQNGPITVTLNHSRPVKAVMIEPGHRRWEGDPEKVVLDKLEVHTVIAIEY